jgi:hypothetical protein
MTRKLYPIVNLLILAAFIMTLSSCKEEKDPCDDTKWESTINYSVQPKLIPAGAVLPDGKVLKEASNLTFIGVVRKYHCGGNLSQDYHMESQHDPRAIDDNYWNNGFYVGRVYGFDFNNDEDYLEFQYALAVYFGDGSVYELDVQLLQVKPPFIPDWPKSYFNVSLGPGMVWIHKR